jgi:hypothetical protein
MQALLFLLNILYYCKTKMKAQGASISLKKLEIESGLRRKCR